MTYDDTRFSHWDDPDDSDDGNGEDAHDANLYLGIFDAIGECVGCGVVGMVNGWQFCEFCMDEFE